MRILMLLLSAFSLSILASVATLAQANNGAGESKPQVHVDSYKLPPGRQDEWLALYKKADLLMMKWQIKYKQLISETGYTCAVHELSPSWDIAIVIALPSASQRKKPELTRAQLMRKIYSDFDELVKEEKQRCSLTPEHWDECWVEVDIQKNPSFYYLNSDQIENAQAGL